MDGDQQMESDYGLENALRAQEEARKAITTGQYQQAMESVREGLECLEPLPPSEAKDGVRFGLILERGWAKRFSAEFESALADFQLVRAEAQAPSRRTGALVGVGDAYSKLGEYGLAAEAYQQALEEAEEIGDTLSRIRGWKGLGSIYWRQGRMEDAIQTLNRARAFLREQPNAFELGDVMLSLGIAYNFSGRFDQAIDAYREALDCFRSVGLDHGVVLALNNLGEVHQELYDLDTALRYHREALEAAGAVEVLSIEVDVRRNIGVDLARMERYSEAMSYLEQALALARERADRDVAMQVLYSLGDAYLRQGQVDRAVALARELEAEATAVQGEFHLTRAKLLWGRAYLAQGNRQQAQAVLQDALANAHALPSRILLWELHAALGRASVDPEVARIHLQIAADFIHQTIEPLSDARIRTGFLERPEVKAVLRAVG